MKKIFFTVSLLLAIVPQAHAELIAIAETTDHGFILLTDIPFPGNDAALIYKTSDAFGRFRGSGAYVLGDGNGACSKTTGPKGCTKIITAMYLETGERLRWNASDFHRTTAEEFNKKWRTQR
jgi:hypothetical protein